MSMTDPIADMLTRIRNALMVRHNKVEMPASQIKAEIAALLAHEGYIKDFKIVRDDKQGSIIIALKYSEGAPALRGLKRVSKPGLRIYAKANEVPSVLNGTGTAVLSTNKGILSDVEAREAHVGGEVLCHVW